MTIADDIEVPTWVKVRGSTIPLVLVAEPVPGSSCSWSRPGRSARNVGTLNAGAAKSVVGLRLTAPGIRSAQILRSAAARSCSALAVEPGPRRGSAGRPRRLAWPGRWSMRCRRSSGWIPKSRTGPSRIGMTPVGVSIGAVEGVSVNGKE